MSVTVDKGTIGSLWLRFSYDAQVLEIEALVGTIDNENKESVIIGDTNCNYDNPSNHYTKHLKKIISAYKLTQLMSQHEPLLLHKRLVII